MKVLVIGSGLIGTSIALKLKSNGHQIWIDDSDQANLALAKDLIGNNDAKPEFFDLIIIATPIGSILDIAKNLKSFNDKSTVIDIGGLKSKLLVEVEKIPDLAKIYVSTHPMAGREFTGPTSARADLFEGRAWLITPTKSASKEAIAVAEKIGAELGSTTYLMDSNLHDSTIAAVSHMPQILSSLMGQLIDSEDSKALNFAGQGLRDVSRLADSDGQMWSELLIENQNELSSRIDKAIAALGELKNSLKSEDKAKVLAFFNSGKSGRGKIPGKHGAKQREYSYLPIVIDDKPGQLAKIFDECAECSVNVEDLSIEHSPNQATGLITLALSESDAQKLKKHLQLKGWLAQEIRR
jgi:prephenate dehydrogenase